jgi:hypothetical protein
MKRLIVSFFTMALLCGPSGVFAAGGSGLDGEYIENGVENSTLTITADHWTLGGTFKMDYTYTAKKTGENTYELELKTVNRYMKGMERTATNRRFTFCVPRWPSLRPMLALGVRRSSVSR